MGHVLGLGHSYDTPDRKNASWSAPGEYFDPWDIMSAMAIYGFSNTNGLTAGPDLNASSKILMGWMPTKDVQWINLSDLSSIPLSLTLDRYDQPNRAHPLVVGVPLEDGRFYTVEFRLKSGWDRGIPRSGVMIHRVERNGTRPYIMPGGAYQPGEVFTSDEGLHLEILAIDIVAGTTTITLSRLAQPLSLSLAKPLHEASESTQIPQLPFEGI